MRQHECEDEVFLSGRQADDADDRIIGIHQADVMSDRDRVSPTRPRTDIGTSTRRLMIAMLGGLIDVERDLIRTRTAEGRSWAQQRRRRMRRPPKLTIVLQPIPAQIPPISLPFPPYTTLHPPQCRPRRDY